MQTVVHVQPSAGRQSLIPVMGGSIVGVDGNDRGRSLGNHIRLHLQKQVAAVGYVNLMINNFLAFVVLRGAVGTGTHKDQFLFGLPVRLLTLRRSRGTCAGAAAGKEQDHDQQADRGQEPGVHLHGETG